MNDSILVNRRAVAAITTVAIIVIAAAVFLSGRGQSSTEAARGNTSISNSTPSNSAVDLSPSQLNSIKIEPVGIYRFDVEKEAVGNISYADDLSVDVYPQNPGTIIKALVELGVPVQKDQPLYTIKSPDLIQAESTLIGAAATDELTTKELARAKDLYITNVGVPQKELEQAISDQQTAEGAIKAARDAVRVFGKADAEIDQLGVCEDGSVEKKAVSPLNAGAEGTIDEGAARNIAQRPRAFRSDFQRDRILDCRPQARTLILILQIKRNLACNWKSLNG